MPVSEKPEIDQKSGDGLSKKEDGSKVKEKLIITRDVFDADNREPTKEPSGELVEIEDSEADPLSESESGQNIEFDENESTDKESTLPLPEEEEPSKSSFVEELPSGKGTEKKPIKPDEDADKKANARGQDEENETAAEGKKTDRIQSVKLSDKEKSTKTHFSKIRRSVKNFLKRGGQKKTKSTFSLRKLLKGGKKKDS